MQIVFGENTRTVQDYQASIGEGGYKEVYTFDRFGRVISLHITDMASNTVYEYVYKTDTDRFPSEMKWTITEEAYHSEGTYQYQYLLFDKYGNWAKRNVRKIDKPKGNKGYNPRTKKTAYVETASYVYS